MEEDDHHVDQRQTTDNFQVQTSLTNENCSLGVVSGWSTLFLALYPLDHIVGVYLHKYLDHLVHPNFSSPKERQSMAEAG